MIWMIRSLNYITSRRPKASFWETRVVKVTYPEVPEVRGGDSRSNSEKKKTKIVLEKWSQAEKERTQGSTRKSKPRKRSTVDDNPNRPDYKDIRRMFENMGSVPDKESIFLKIHWNHLAGRRSEKIYHW